MKPPSGRRGRQLRSGTWEGIFDALAVPSALVGADGRIVRVNRAWRALFADSSVLLEDAGLGASYLEVCERAQRWWRTRPLPALASIGCSSG